jgi:NADPH:quinone reductase-like Zn-dependent oxidoreductase
MTFEEAAAGLATGGLTALCVLRKASIEAGQKVLIYGASGSVGVFAVQLAKYFGAAVTGVCSSRNFELMRTLGTDAVLDYTQPEFVACEQTFDVVFDAVGKLSRADAIRLSGDNGRRFSVARDVGPAARITTAELQLLTELVEAGKLRTFIDRQYAEACARPGARSDP